MLQTEYVEFDTESNILMKIKRDQFAIEIRKKKNAHTINAKRMKFSKLPEGRGSEDFKLLNKDDSEMGKYFAQLVSNFKLVLSDPNTSKLEVVLAEIRKSISMERQIPVDCFYSSGILPDIARLLDNFEKYSTNILSEALWILMNVAAQRDQDTIYVAETLDGLSRTLRIFYKTDDEDLIDHCVWLLSNLAGTSIKYRDVLIGNDIIENMIKFLASKAVRREHLKNWTWLVSNLCAGKPAPDYNKVCVLLPFLSDCMKSNDPSILENVLWTASYLTAGDNNQLDDVMQYISLSVVISHARKDAKNELRIPSIRIIGNFLSGTSQHTAMLVREGVIPLISEQLNSSKANSKAEALWSLSNILADSQTLIQKVLEHKEIIPHMIYLLQTDKPEVKKEALHCVCNMIAHGSDKQVQILTDLKVMDIIVEIMNTNKSAEFLKLALESLESLLAIGQPKETDKNPNYNLLRFEKAGGVMALQELQNHPETEIYNLVGSLIDKYFDY